MSNTKVTIEFSNGDTREFMASDELEKMIQAGEMFSVTTNHPDQDDKISKMYAGNPMVALGNMVIMRHNAEKLGGDSEDKHIIIDILTVCIKLLSDEITSHDSGLIKGNTEIEGREDCPAIQAHCNYFSYECDSNGEIKFTFCGHVENLSREVGEGNCTSFLCPLCTEGGGRYGY